MNYSVRVGDENFTISATDTGSGEVKINAAVVKVDFRRIRDNLYHLLVNDEAYTVQLDQGKSEVTIGPYTFSVHVEDERNAAIKKKHRGAQTESGISTIKAPMPGLVVRLEAQPGEVVKKGQGLVVIEAMKMENEIKAPLAGTVMEIMTAVQMTVEKDTPLLRIKPAA